MVNAGQRLAILALLPLTVACAGTGRGGAEEAATVKGAGTAVWGEPGASRNFHWKYETVAWNGDSSGPFHRMKTELALAYDPEQGRVRGATLVTSGQARSLRNVILTPAGPLLRIRVSTVLSARSEDRTVLSIGHPAAIGVGPVSGLVEAIQVRFEDDGSYRVLPDTGAHLAGANVRVARRMTQAPGATDPISTEFP
jgi:hypothetical protein